MPAESRRMPAMAESIDIKTAAEAPKKAKGDEGEIEAHSLKDQIEADRYLAAKNKPAAKLGIQTGVMRPPGAV